MGYEKLNLNFGTKTEQFLADLAETLGVSSWQRLALVLKVTLPTLKKWRRDETFSTAIAFRIKGASGVAVPAELIREER